MRHLSQGSLHIPSEGDPGLSPTSQIRKRRSGKLGQLAQLRCVGSVGPALESSQLCLMPAPKLETDTSQTLLTLRPTIVAISVSSLYL